MYMLANLPEDRMKQFTHQLGIAISTWEWGAFIIVWDTSTLIHTRNIPRNKKDRMEIFTETGRKDVYLLYETADVNWIS